MLRTSARTLSSARVLSFQKESVSLFIKSTTSGTPASTPSLSGDAPLSGARWQPTHGNSFRSFAEYRLKATNLSPLAVRSKKSPEQATN